LKSAADLAPALWSVEHPDPKIRAAFRYTEEMWAKLLKEPHPRPGGSLLPTPYDELVPAGRFTESYYWDTYFAIMALLKTDRLEIAQMQVENFLSWIRKYGFVPNGGRDYYLSRSQPPFISSMVREVYEASLKKATTEAQKAKLDRWLRERAYPLIKADYEKFWMNRKTRYDARTGLNHHWDDIDLPRPERHSADKEFKLGRTPRDVRAVCESGLDFTNEFGNEASQVAAPLLNSMLYKTETDLTWAAKTLGLQSEAETFAMASTHRKASINRYLWDSKTGTYRAFNLRSGRHSNVLSADTFAPLFVGAANRVQAARVRSALKILEKPGGIMASDDLSSIDQWDGKNGFAPFQVMPIQGLALYGYAADSRRIAQKWVHTLAEVYAKHKAFYERVDVVTRDRPKIDEHKYPVQEGFLWTNSSFIWALTDVLKAPLTRQ
jgi:alpha,alpha-trehalase